MGDDKPLWDRFRAVAATGSDADWKALLVEREPELTPMARNQPIGRLRSNDDTPREIVTRVLESLHARGFAAISAGSSPRGASIAML